MKAGFCLVIFPSKNSLFWKLRQKIKGKSPLKFLSISDIKKLSAKYHFKIVKISGILLAPPRINFLANRIIGILPPTIRNLILDIFSKSLVVVLQKNEYL